MVARMYGGVPSIRAVERTIGFDDTRMCAMFHAVAAVLILAWLFGFVTAQTVGGLLHILPVIAVELVVLQVIVGEDLV